MRTIQAVFAYTVKEHLRHKAWLSAALFGFVLLAGGMVVSAIAQDERSRFMLDLGLSANEIIALVSMIFLTVHLILQEVESRAVYLILSHPVRRSDYLLGRFLGTLFSVGAAMALMGAAHWLVLQLFGGVPLGKYMTAWACSFGKTAVMGALSLLLSLALTSEAAAMAFSVFFWILGHFSSEMRFLAERSGNAALKTSITAFSHAAPDFAHFNFRDHWHGAQAGDAWLLWAGVYVAGYCAACLALSVQIFEQKEF